MENPKFIEVKGEKYLVVQDNPSHDNSLRDIVRETLGTKQQERRPDVKQILVFPSKEVIRRENRDTSKIKQLVKRFTP